MFEQSEIAFEILLWLCVISLCKRSTYCWCLLIAFENNLDPDQARQNVGPDQSPNRLALCWYPGRNVRKSYVCKLP